MTPTPELLSSVLSDGDLLFFRTRALVEEPLECTREEVVELYAKRLASLIEEPRWGKIERFLVATADVPVDIRETTQGTHKTLSPERPGIWLSEQSLDFAPPDHLSATVHFSRDWSGFGLAFEFPRVASLSEDGYRIRHDMTTSPSGRAFVRIAEAMKLYTKPLVVEGPTRKWRLPIRISPELKPYLANHPLLSRNSLHIR